MNGAIDKAGKPGGSGRGTENQVEISVVVLDSDGSESEVDGGEDSAAKAGEVGIGSSRSCVFRPIPPFLQKLYDILGNDQFNSLVSWSCSGTSFIIKNSHLFAANILPIYFKHNNFQSFISQLNSYCFKKISWEQCEYRNEYFRRGEVNLLKKIKRRDHHSSRIQPPSNVKPWVNTPSCSSDVEKELTILMKEHHQVKAEIMKLKEKQQTFEEKFASLENQATSIKDGQRRMMLVAQRILKKQEDPSSCGVPMLEESRETDQKYFKGKRKLEAKSTKTQDNEGKMLLDEEEMAKHQQDTFISLEDLLGGSSDWVEYISQPQEKANRLQS